MLKRLLVPLLSMILSNITAINARLAALEAGETAETADEAATEVEMQQLLDSMTREAPAPENGII